MAILNAVAFINYRAAENILIL